MKFYYFIFFLLLSCVESSNEDLPILGPSDFKGELVDNNLNKLQSHFVSDFELINQNGDTITNKDYEDKIYVVDFFFTRCGSICPIMTNNMKKIQDEFIENDKLMLLSISVTPNIDNVATLKKYAKSKGVINSKWNIATGNKKHIYELARKSYFAVLKKGDGGLQDFIHTPNFILIDKKKQIRGIYDGTNDTEIKRVIKDIKTLQIKNS
jgi:protein SCO1/2